jgi:hypothetical protein
MELFVILLGVLLAAILHKPEKPKDEKLPKKPEVKMFPLREEVYTNEHGQTIKRTEYITPVINNYPAAWTEPNNQRE